MREWISAWWDGGEALEPPSQAAFFAFSAGLLLFAIGISRAELVPLVDHANLAFHEAGHLLFRILGDTMSLYGGTLMQFVFPALTTLHFARGGKTLSAAACAAWFCENFRYTALYMADARAGAAAGRRRRARLVQHLLALGRAAVRHAHRRVHRIPVLGRDARDLVRAVAHAAP
jgi:hypothetical protein